MAIAAEDAAVNSGLDAGKYPDAPIKDGAIDIKEFKSCFNKVMTFRNAFAHGQIAKYPDEGVIKVHHFHGKPEVHTLDEKRWVKLEGYCLLLHQSLTAWFLKVFA